MTLFKVCGCRKVSKFWELGKVIKSRELGKIVLYYKGLRCVVVVINQQSIRETITENRCISFNENDFGEKPDFLLFFIQEK